MSDSMTKPPIATTVTGSRETSDQVEIKVVNKDGKTTAELVNFSKKNEMFVGSYESARDAYENNKWFREFFFEIIEMYGYPISITGCISQKEKIMFSWAILNVTSALRKERGLWCTLFDVDDPIMTADFFCRTFYERRKMHVIPAMPTSPGKKGLVFTPHADRTDDDNNGSGKNEN